MRARQFSWFHDWDLAFGAARRLDRLVIIDVEKED